MPRGAAAGADRAAAPRMPLGSGPDGDLDHPPHGRGGLRGRRGRARDRGLSEAPRRARRPALPDDVPGPALPGGGGGDVGRRRAGVTAKLICAIPRSWGDAAQTAGEVKLPLGGHRKSGPTRTARASSTTCLLVLPGPAVRGQDPAAGGVRLRLRVPRLRRARSPTSSASCRSSCDESDGRIVPASGAAGRLT